MNLPKNPNVKVMPSLPMKSHLAFSYRDLGSGPVKVFSHTEWLRLMGRQIILQCLTGQVK